MSIAGYEPRAYAVNPKGFGKERQIEWKQVDDPVEQDRLLAAKIQHKYAVKITERRRELGITLVALSAREGTSSYRANIRTLTGEVCMRLDFIATADRVLGNIL
jgi:hypothetical protein